MTTITLHADEELVESARERARRERTTLDEAFGRWLEQYARYGHGSGDAAATIRDLQRYARTGGRTFSRDELNAR